MNSNHLSTIASRYGRRTRRNLRLSLAGGLALAALLPWGAQAQNQLVTGKKITLPPVGSVQSVGSLPMNLIATPDGKYVISTDMGFRQSLVSLRATNGMAVSRLNFPGGEGVPNQVAAAGSNGLYYGLAIQANKDGTSTLYAAQGQPGKIAVVHVGVDGSLTQTGAFPNTPLSKDFTAGIALFTRNGVTYLAAAENDPNTFLTPCSLAIFNTATGAEVGRFQFVNPGFASADPRFYAPNFPLAVSALADGSKIFVSSQRDGTVTVLNAANPVAPSFVASIATGAHPDALLLNRAQSRLFVANAHSDTVSVLDTATNAVTATILLRPTGATTIAGATPTNLALSPDEKRLYVTLGDMNAVAQVNLTNNSVQGYIPTGWYPTGVVATAQKKLLVSNAKGTTTRYPNPGYVLVEYNDNPGYGLNKIEGNVEFISVPNTATLASHTRQTMANNSITATTATPHNPLASIGLLAGQITHVIYIVKENRTYDQVLGDMKDSQGNPIGNGSPALTLFGENITPNQHALARRFVLLDNFYDCGEASGDGWPWSTQGIATEYVIKNLPYNYSGRGRNYDFEGQDNGYLSGGFPATDPDGKPLVSPGTPLSAGAPAITDVSETPANHIWDLVQRGGLSYRNYGFFYSFGVNVGPATVLPDNYPTAAGLLPPGHDLTGKSDFDFRRYDNDYADSDAPQTYFNQATTAGDPNAPRFLYSRTTFGKHNASSRFSEWNTEFQQMVAKDPTGGTGVPNFMTVRFHHDHTQGYTSGKHTPQSEVADNDYAVGQLVQTISSVPSVWDHTAIFVIEDDSQDGPDHVDSHRSTCYVISPFIKKSSVDHTFYNTDSVLKTMELLLGLPPMSQYDAVANPILAFDNAATNGAAYAATLPSANIVGDRLAVNLPKNSPLSRLAKLSAQLDFAHPDSADPRTLNEILWKGVKGVNSRMPEPRHALSFRAVPAKADKGRAAMTAHTAGKAKTARHDDDDD
jgi:YVTN family beta-propeller protein